jgi:hypothetical protein
VGLALTALLVNAALPLLSLSLGSDSEINISKPTFFTDDAAIAKTCSKEEACHEDGENELLREIGAKEAELLKISTNLNSLQEKLDYTITTSKLQNFLQVRSCWHVHYEKAENVREVREVV